MGKPTICLANVAGLRNAIRAGEYADKPFPSEAQLMRKFGVGRQTAVRILNQLADEGLIVRRKGAGNFQSVELVKNASAINRRILSTFDGADVPVVLLASDVVRSPERSRYDLVAVNHVLAGRRLGDVAFVVAIGMGVTAG